jgi:hypothetical protein
MPSVETDKYEGPLGGVIASISRIGPGKFIRYNYRHATWSTYRTYASQPIAQMSDPFVRRVALNGNTEELPGRTRNLLFGILFCNSPLPFFFSFDGMFCVNQPIDMKSWRASLVMKSVWNVEPIRELQA